jgi:hypothetical protein
MYAYVDGFKWICQNVRLRRGLSVTRNLSERTLSDFLILLVRTFSKFSEIPCPMLRQGCQMVYLYTKNINLVTYIFKALECLSIVYILWSVSICISWQFGIFCGHLVHDGTKKNLATLVGALFCKKCSWSILPGFELEPSVSDPGHCATLPGLSCSFKYFLGSATPCASPPPWPSIFSESSFWVHHLVNRDG